MTGYIKLFDIGDTRCEEIYISYKGNKVLCFIKVIGEVGNKSEGFSLGQTTKDVGV